MRPRFVLLLIVACCASIGLLHAQKEFREYPGQTPTPLPKDYKEPHEWVWGRLRYDSPGGGFFGGGGRGRRGGFGGGWGPWATDYSKGDRILLSGIKRLTLLDTRSVEQVIDLDGSDDIYNWPFLYAVEVGRWVLDDAQAAQLRDFLDRGGFLMVDDFHCDDEWESFMESFQLVYPDKDVVDIPDGDPITRTVFQLDLRQQIPGAQFNRSGRMDECNGRRDPAPHWRAVYDDKNRITVAIAHNSDLGDAIEYADAPYYPQEFAQAAFQILSNYVIYNLTH